MTFKTSTWHLALHSLIFSSQKTHLLTKKNQKKNIFKNSLWNYSENWCKTTWKCENWKWPLVSFTSIFSASSWPIVKSKVSFEILRMSRFQNWPSFLNFVKIWGSYCQNTKVLLFCGHGVVHLTIWALQTQYIINRFSASKTYVSVFLVIRSGSRP